MRDIYYDLFAPSLAGLAEPIYRERGLFRNELVLLRVTAPGPVALTSASGETPRE
jgi:hypothetical protein